mmetsp:Transcript_9685/g.20344  ORF Transcript_9685/g.20344 Transcript_9685/m.20344 type:complete len:232 (+) Transcript_9685:1695-2390(+)
MRRALRRDGRQPHVLLPREAHGYRPLFLPDTPHAHALYLSRRAAHRPVPVCARARPRGAHHQGGCNPLRRTRRAPRLLRRRHHHVAESAPYLCGGQGQLPRTLPLPRAAQTLVLSPRKLQYDRRRLGPPLPCARQQIRCECGSDLRAVPPDAAARVASLDAGRLRAHHVRDEPLPPPWQAQWRVCDRFPRELGVARRPCRRRAVHFLPLRQLLRPCHTVRLPSCYDFLRPI